MVGKHRTRPGQGSAFGHSNVTFGIKGEYTNAEDAIAAYESAFNNPILGIEGTTGAAGFAGNLWRIDSEGKPVGNADNGVTTLGGWGLPYTLPGYQLGEVNIAQQEQAPDNPGIRKAAFSTYGVPIPVSIGRRAVTGNVIDATDFIPAIIGSYDYWVEYQVPIYKAGPGVGPPVQLEMQTDPHLDENEVFMPPGIVGQQYRFEFFLVNYVGTPFMEIGAGGLPPNLSFTHTGGGPAGNGGVISGIPASIQEGAAIEIKGTDTGTGETLTRHLYLVVNE